MFESDRLDEIVPARVADPGVGWWVLGAVFLALVAWIGFQYLGWLVFGLFTYYVGRPVTRRLSRRVSRSLAAGLTLLFIIVPILLFVTAFLSVALGQAITFLSSDAAASIISKLPLPTTQLPTDPVRLAVVIVQDPQFSSILDQFGLALGVFTATLFNVFLMLIFAFFLLVEDSRLSAWFERNVFGRDSLSVGYLRSVDRGLTSVYFGYTLTIFAVVLLAALIYGLFNVLAPGGLDIPSAMLLAVVTGVFTLIPLVGRSIVYALIVALLSVQAVQINTRLLWVPAVFFLFMVLVFDNLVRTYIRPYLSGKAYNMALVMFAYLLGPALFGWYGIFLGPLVMVLLVEFTVDILPRLAAVEDEQTELQDTLPEPEPADEGQFESGGSGDTGRGDRGGSPSG